MESCIKVNVSKYAGWERSDKMVHPVRFQLKWRSRGWYHGLVGKAITCDTSKPDERRFETWLLHLQRFTSLSMYVGKQHRIDQVLLPLYPNRRFGRSPQFLVLAQLAQHWLSQPCCLVREQAYGRYLSVCLSASLCNSAYQIHKPLKKIHGGQEQKKPNPWWLGVSASRTRLGNCICKSFIKLCTFYCV